ncbi:MAG: hypothetical protein ABSD46_09200 [Bacteroidota bacterium]
MRTLYTSIAISLFVIALSAQTFETRNKIDLKVGFSLKVINQAYNYNYSLTNGPIAQESVCVFDIRLLTNVPISNLDAPLNWRKVLFTKTPQLIRWHAHVDDETGRYGKNLLGPGVSRSGFSFNSSNSLPGILIYYSEGWAPAPVFEEGEATDSIPGYTDLTPYGPGVVGKTVGPLTVPNPFVPLNFLDTLANYTTQSHALEWIKDDATANKYLGYYTSAKTSLQQNNIALARTTLQQVLQDVNVDSTANLTSEAYALIRYNTEYLLTQIPIPPSGLNVKLINSTGTKLTSGALQYYEGSWKDATNNQDGTFSINTKLKTLSLRMTYEYGTQTKSNVSISNDTIVFQTINAQVQLQNSNSVLIDTGSVQYYAGAWRNLGTTINGIATKELLPNTYSFRMTYAYASKDKQQDIGTNAIVIFQTVNAAIQLKNSQGSLMDQGTVQYYSGAWRDLGITTNGVAKKELLPNNYSFRMTYAYASKDKQQDIGTNATVIFQTVNAAVQLQNSQGTLIDQGTVQYYSGAWRDLGNTTNGVANKELLPNNYSFRMTYAYASKDKQQDIGTNATVVFQTVNAAVQLQNSQGALMDQGTVQYYSGAWRDLGTTTNGVATKELLPNSYSFRMTYAFVSKDKQQDISTNATVVFQTVNAAVQLKNSLGALIDQGTVQYYSGAWRTLGTTTNGIANKELLPNNYSFRMTYEYVSVDKSQDLSANSTVSFSTVLCTIRVKNSQNQLVNNAMASYYSGAWRQIGNTVNGVITKELLPVNISFRVKYGTQQQDKQQNLSTNNVVEFGIQ